jgi:mono/diheme cytochrome c family protein
MPVPNEPVSLLLPVSSTLLRVLLVLANFVHLSIAGFMAGGTALAFLFLIHGRRERNHTALRLAADLLRKAPLNGSLLVLLLAAATVSLLCVKFLYDPGLLTIGFWGGTLLLLSFGLALLRLSRYLFLHEKVGSHRDVLLGFAGAVLVLAAAFVLICASALLVMPEKWPFLLNQPRLFLSWNGVARFLEFAALSLSITGAGVLTLGVSAERKGLRDPDFCSMARQTGTALTVSLLLAWPLLLLFDLLTLPELALSAGIFVLAAVSLTLAMVIALVLGRHPDNRKGRRSGAVLLAVLGLFFIWLLADDAERGNVLSEPVLLARALTVTPAQAEEQGEEQAEETSGGKGVFEKICARCHRFDSRLVGPPLNEVVPPYREDIEALKAFIRNPVKKNPDYPAMPRLGLADEEIAAVAAYLLEQTAP